MILSRPRLDALLSQLPAVRAAVLGDFALDLYYTLELDTGRRSLETGKPVHFARDLRCYPGGAAVIARNLRALGRGPVAVFGVTGDDCHGRELRYGLVRQGIVGDGLLEQARDWETQTYTKPHVGREEQSRIDFGANNRLLPETRHRLLAALATRLPELDCLLINQQAPEPVLSAELAAPLRALLAQFPRLVIVVDAREQAAALRGPVPLPGLVFRLNRGEIARLLGQAPPAAEDGDACRALARQGAERLGSPLVLTRGEFGTMACHGDALIELPAPTFPGPRDPVGAGDAYNAAMALALTAGASLAEACTLGSLAAGVTVSKIGETGVATPAEVQALHAHCSEIA